MMYRVLIGLGSNLDSPCLQLQSAIEHISSHEAISLVNCSSFYESLPQGPQDQDNYVNAVIAIDTTLESQTLLAFLQSIEQQQGRVKTRHWGERSIDLDILFMQGPIANINLPDLIIPHPHALTRDFVLIPALEIAPDWCLPDGTPLSERLPYCLKHDLKKLDAHL
jgi:2-amino-4-hydroxy-6-hydroxymethyldihydropteridine diphosphokinase